HADAPAELLRHAGFGALSLDLTGIGTAAARLDPIAEAVEAGVVLLAGLVPTTPPGAAEATGASARSAPAREQGPERETAGRYDFHDVANPLLDLWRRLGLADAR